MSSQLQIALTIIKPPRKALTSYQIPVKIHKITVMLSLAPSDSISQLKEQVLQAIKQFQESDPEFESEETEKIPSLTSTEQFELHKRVRDGKKFTGETTLLGDEENVKNVIMNWEPIIVRIKEDDGGFLLVWVMADL
jgi:hypothetical protein